MVCHYSDTIAPDVNSSITYNSCITYNSRSNLLLNDNLDMSYTEMKETICYELEWNYNDINAEITSRC
jgi:hypothetical protein